MSNLTSSTAHPSSEEAHPSSEETDTYENTVAPPSRDDILKKLKKPSSVRWQESSSSWAKQQVEEGWGVRPDAPAYLFG